MAYAVRYAHVDMEKSPIAPGEGKSQTLFFELSASWEIERML